jgi:uncharacterized membrane protein YgdD (TMEM256/DUF423 family)
MIEIQRKIFITATLLGLVGVVLGAFAAHGLRSVLTDSAPSLSQRTNSAFKP